MGRQCCISERRRSSWSSLCWWWYVCVTVGSDIFHVFYFFFTWNGYLRYHQFSNIRRVLLDHWHTSNQFDMKISRWHLIFGGVYMPSITRSVTNQISQKIFFQQITQSTRYLVIMMIGVILCKINEEINYVSVFHNNVVRIWLRNRPAKLL